MKLSFNLLLVLLLTSVAILPPDVFAQNWNPLSSGNTLLYQYRDTQNNRTAFVAAKSDSVRVEGLDTACYLYRMVAMETSSQTVIGCNSQTIYPGFRSSADHFLGKKMLLKPDGDALFISSAGDTFLLRTLALLGEAWNWNDTTIANVFATSSEPVLGQVDSLKHIALSTGDTIILGKSSGLVKMFSFFQPPSPRLVGRPMELWGIPERGLGGVLPDVGEIFGFSVGDAFGRYDSYHSYPFGGYRVEWNTHYRIDSIFASSNGPSYKVWIEQNKKITSIQQGNSQQYYPPQADTLEFDPVQNAHHNLLPFQASSSYLIGSYYQMIQTGMYRWNLDTNRIVQRFDFGFLLDTCSGYFHNDGLMYNSWAEYVSGIGLWQWQESGFDWSDLKTTTCFHTQLGDYDICPTFNTLAAPDPTVETDGFEVFPNPASSNLNLSWTKSSGVRNVVLLRMDGAVVADKTLAKGEAQTIMDISSLNEGVYLLKVTEKGKQPTMQRVVIIR